MELDGPQQKQLQEALISAFPTRQDLEQMVFHRLDVHLLAITTEGTLSRVVFELLRWAQARGRLEELITAALAQNSGNPQLISVAAQLGVSSGQSSSDVPLAPTFPRIWNIPYPRNPFFTGQEKVLTQLATVLKAGQATALSQPQAITGLGGIGKTQIAVEFAYRHALSYEAVLWVLADTRESLVSGYIAVAQLLNLPLKDEQEQAVIVQAVKSWLQTHGSWLLILDNADDLAMAYEFLPPTFDGHLLLTTRARATGTQAHRIEVEVMPEDVGALFLLHRGKLVPLDVELARVNAADVTIAKEICQELGGLPLALDQAGAYIEEVECSLLDYQQRYRSRRASLLKRRGNMGSEHPDPVAATWSLAFEKVEQRSLASADLLRVCAFLAPDAIAEEIIVEGASHLGPSLALVAEDDLALDEAIAPLLAYSLVRRDQEKKTLSVHRLVQAVLKDEMDEQTRRQWAERAVLAVDATFPVVEFTDWPQYERCLPHALVCAELIEKEQIEIKIVTRLLHVAGDYLKQHARYLEAEPLFMCAFNIREKQLGPKHPDTVTIVNDLARLYRNQGRYAEAEPLFMCVLTLREEQLGPTHPLTAGSLNNLAALYYSQGRYAEAEPLFMRALKVYKVQLGPMHPDTATSQNNLAMLYSVQGKYEDAESLYKCALKIREERLGSMHPDTAVSLYNLATHYDEQGKDDLAEPLFQRARAPRDAA